MELSCSVAVSRCYLNSENTCRGIIHVYINIFQGGVLEFQTQGQPLPDSMKQTLDVINIKISDVDDETKAAIL